MKNEIIIQIFTGGYTEYRTTYEDIERKLKPILDTGKVKRVLMGWSRQPEIYTKTKELLRQYGTEIFLWIPVFSETGLIKPVKRLIDDKGEQVKSYSLKSGENFEFYCPLDSQNIKSFIEIYEENFADIGFDGVFLDKIRYGAFSNGISGVFSCFCPICEKTYKADGICLNEIKSEMANVRLGIDGYEKSPLKIKRYEDGKYEFENDLWSRFFKKKQNDIINVLSKITDYFHKEGMLVGMDTFSPFTAYFAGQDVARLGKLADFIKPMMYRITNAPAGLSFEADCLIKEVTNSSYQENSQQLEQDFYNKINCRKILGEVFDINFVKRELEILTSQGVLVYGGVEFNKNEAALADPSYIRTNFEELKDTNIEGLVMSWDLLTAPQENIDTVISYIRD